MIPNQSIINVLNESVIKAFCLLLLLFLDGRSTKKVHLDISWFAEIISWFEIFTISSVISLFFLPPLQIYLDVILHSICSDPIGSSFLKTDQAYSKMHFSNQYFKPECVLLLHILNNVEMLSTPTKDNCIC